MSRTTSARWRALPIWIATLTLALALPALAQTDVTTSRVSGAVRDVDNSPLPGATVEATNLGTGLVQTAVTRNDGLSSSTCHRQYSVTATLSGFRTRAARCPLDIGTAATWISSCRSARRSRSPSPPRRPSVTNTSASTPVQTEQLKSLPMNGRNYQTWSF